MRSVRAKTILVGVVGSFLCSSWCSAIAQNRENELDKFKARWQLRFVPEELPDYEKQINGTMWSKEVSSRNGAGGIRWIVFPEKTGEVRFIRFISKVFNPRDEPRVRWVDESHPLVLVGPFLEYDRKVRTFALDGEDNEIVLDAAVKIKDQRWYHLEVWGQNNDNGEYVFIAREHGYEFVDNPWTVKAGAVNLQIKLRSSNGILSKVYQLRGQFDRSGQGEPTEQCELSFSAPLPEGSSTSAPKLILVRGKNYAFFAANERGIDIFQKSDINRLSDLKKSPPTSAGYGSR
jgi:hypothetical protein